MSLIVANNVVGGGDSWVCDANGIPEKKILAVGSNSVVFNIPSTEYGYEPYINAADGQAKPKWSNWADDTANLTITLTVPGVTSAQRGTGNECYVMMRIIK